MPSPNCLAGIFVGGQSRRMQGIPKGLLQPPGAFQSLVERTAQHLQSVGISHIVLVGAHPAYQKLPWLMLPDPMSGKGPMSGLLGLLEYALNQRFDAALAIACDMPFLSRALLQRLTTEDPGAAILVPRRERREPLCARYMAECVLPPLRRLVEGDQLRMMDLLDQLGERCIELQLDAAESKSLEDWDQLSDLPDGVQLNGTSIDLGDD